MLSPVRRRRWTPSEEFYLHNHRSIQPVEAIAERLNRTPAAVVAKLSEYGYTCPPRRTNELERVWFNRGN